MFIFNEYKHILNWSNIFFYHFNSSFFLLRQEKGPKYFKDQRSLLNNSRLPLSTVGATDSTIDMTVKIIDYNLYNTFLSIEILKKSFNTLKDRSIEEIYNIKKLYLSYNQIAVAPIGAKQRSLIATSIPKEIGNLINLQYLYLRNNQIQSIPLEIGKLINSRELHLENNSISNNEKIKIKSSLPNINIYL